MKFINFYNRYSTPFNILFIGVLMLLATNADAQTFNVVTKYKIFEGKGGVEIHNSKTHFEISKESISINGFPERVAAYYWGQDYDGLNIKHVFITETNTFISVVVSKNGNILEVQARSYLLKRPTRYFQSLPESLKYLDYGVTELKSFPYPDSRIDEDKRR